MEAFSEKEFRFLADTDFLLTKREINHKVTALLAETEQTLKSFIQETDFDFPDQAFLKSGKISRGDQYLGLPYWVLDFPRKFSKEATFSFRTMIWWGHEISCFLHLGGKDLEEFMPKILQNLKKDSDRFVSLNSDPWQYHFEEDNYVRELETSAEVLKRHILEHGFHKMIYRFSLQEIEKIPLLANQSLGKILITLQ